MESTTNMDAFNTAYIDECDLVDDACDTTSCWIKYDQIDNYYLEASSLNMDSINSIPRCAPRNTVEYVNGHCFNSFQSTSDDSSIKFQSYEEQDSESNEPQAVNEKDFLYNDSCLLFTTVSQLYDVKNQPTAHCQDTFATSINNTNTTRNETSTRVNCKSMYNYIMKPITKKLCKAFNKHKSTKTVAPTTLVVETTASTNDDDHDHASTQSICSQQKVLQTNIRSNFFDSRIAYSPVSITNLQATRFKNCGDVVAYLI